MMLYTQKIKTHLIKNSRAYSIVSFGMIVVLTGALFSTKLFSTLEVHANGGFETTLVQANAAGVAQIVSFSPLAITTGETFRITINGTGYSVVAGSGDTRATIISALSSTLSTETATSCTGDTTKVTCTAVTPGTPFTYDAVVVPASSFIAATTVPAQANTAQAFLTITGTPNYVFTDGGSGTVRMTHTGTQVNSNPTYEQDLNGDGTYGDAISQISHSVITAGVASGSTVQSVTQISVDTAFTNGNTLIISNCTINFATSGTEDLNCSDNNATVNLTSNPTATSQADRLKFLTGITNYTASDDVGGSNQIFLITHTGTPVSGNPSESSGISDPNNHITVVGDGTGSSVVGIGATQSVDSFSFSGDIPNGAKIRIGGSLIISFANTSSDIDASDNAATLIRFHTAQPKVVTYTPSAVTAGETFVAIINFQAFRYTAGSGDVASTVTAALSPFITSSGAANCVEDGVKITCTGVTGGVNFMADAWAEIAPFITSISSDAPGETLTNTSTLNFQVNYSQQVTGVDVTDFSIDTTGTATYAGYTVTGTGTDPLKNYKIALTGISGNGTISLQALDDNSILNSTTNTPLGGNSISSAFGGPMVTIITAAAAPVAIQHNGGRPPAVSDSWSGASAPATNVSDCTTTSVGSLTADTTFTRDLHFADHGKDVVELQNFLEETGLLVVPPNNIKGLFGLLTQDALKKYQTAACISEDGLGPITRAHLAATVVSTQPTTSSISTSTTQTGHLNVPLYEGVDNKTDVTILQTFLAAQGKDIYPEGTVNGIFDAATQTAVENFQTKYNLCTTTDKAYGYVGPSTRAKINSMLATQ